MHKKAHLSRGAQWNLCWGGATVWNFEVTDLMNYCQTLIQRESKGPETSWRDYLNSFEGYDFNKLKRNVNDTYRMMLRC
jgi:hypothetical protein